ncbi:MAG: response regulator with CheY-like receiver domain and winged-helix DNA-binding domain [Verrucomicrobiaceae bacterium]|nr:response regulator with CheY-like receiver domain and winged-helix DNA-binding domain [Verrucomicrobiaceae bacterium]
MTILRSTVVVIEDDVQIRRFLRTALELEGCVVFEADNAQRGLIEAGTRKPDMLILDLGLPDRDGVEVLRDLRTWSTIPVLILSARAQEEQKIAALDAGADDYLVKPFGVGELLARVRALLRRTLKTAGEQSVMQFGSIRVDLALRHVERDGIALHLTPIEYRLLTHLLANAGKVLTHRQLLRDVWGPTQVENNPSLRVFMAHLRRKLEHDPAQPQHLLTEVGVGYRFVL